ISVAHMAGTLFRVRSVRDDLSRTSRTHKLCLWPDVQRAKKSRLVTDCLYIPINPSIPLPPGYWVNACLSSFHGGKNGLYVAPGVYDGVTEADITSAYPRAMHQLPPLTKGLYQETRTIVPGYCAIYRVTGRVRDSCRYGVFMDVNGRAIIHGQFD